VRGGISLDMTRMNRILEIRPHDFLVRVQAGVTRVRLNEELGRYGLFFPVDPGADATLGGMAATNASGTTAVRYGAMRDNVRALEVVLPNGSVIRTGSLAVKSSSGYNLTALFVGSEGTLGVITELWLKVYGIPERIIAARAEFPDIQSCVQASTAIIGAGIPIARVEFVEPAFIEAVNRFKQTNFPLVPTLFLEFRGSRESVESDVRLTREIVYEEGCTSFQFTADERERNELWEARHHAAYALMHQYPAAKHMATDVCVPLSKLPEAVLHARRTMDEEGVVGAIIGHVGDGNFHASLVIRPDVPDDLERACRVNERIVEFALSLGGTCTGEHGVGIGKKKYQEREHGAAIDVMRAIKSVIDPLHIMNPGKLVDPDD
jgi:D-lactate dehydrogenase (cytochrome)